MPYFVVIRQVGQPAARTSALSKHAFIHFVLGSWRILKNVRYWILHWIVSGAALFIVAQLLPGIQVDGFGSALIAALVIGLVSATIGLILKILLLPFIILTLGIVYFLINGLMLKLA